MAHPHRGRTLLLLVSGIVSMLLVAEIGVRWMTPAFAEPLRWMDDMTQRKALQIARLGAEGQRFDVVFAGTSQTGFGIDPDVIARETGGAVRAYNAALNAATPTVQRRWLLDTVLPRLQPRTVVLGVSSYDLNDNSGAAAGVNGLWASAPASRTDLFGRASRRMEQVSALVRWRARLRQPDEMVAAFTRRLSGESGPRLQPPPGGGISDTGFGLYFRNIEFNPSARNTQQIRDFVLGGWEAGGQAMADLEKLIDALHARGVEVVLAEMPVTPDFIGFHPRGAADYELFRAMIAEFARAQGVPLLLADPSFVARDWFADLDHLNARGSTPLSIAMARALSSTRLVPGPVAALTAAGTVTPAPTLPRSRDLLPDRPDRPLPPVTAPPTTTTTVTSPPVTAPPVTAPPVTAPPVTAPPLTAPPLASPTARLP